MPSPVGMTFVTARGAHVAHSLGLTYTNHTWYRGMPMPPKMAWLTAIVQLSVAPVFLGALFLMLSQSGAGRTVATEIGLVLLGLVHVLYWSRPWPVRQRYAVVAAAAMVGINLILLHGLSLSQPLLWLYPALVVGAGLRPPAAALAVGLMALAAVLPSELAAKSQVDPFGTGHTLLLSTILGPGHAMLLAVALAGLGMAAVRQLIVVNADLHEARAELAELAVTTERERLGRELHDVLGRTLSLIAVKAELGARLSETGNAAAGDEMRDVQRLAREALWEVRQAVSGHYVPSLAAELAAAPTMLRAAGIEADIRAADEPVHPALAAGLAWALREAVTNVVRHSGARTCWIRLQSVDGRITLEVSDDGRGPSELNGGMGLEGLAQRIKALDGTLQVGRSETGGFQLRVVLNADAPPHVQAVLAR